MKRRNLARLAGSLIAVVFGSAFLVATLPSAPSGAATAPAGQYVALGDSYSSGEGLDASAGDYIPPTNTAADSCHRSTKAYPELVAKSLGLALHTFNTSPTNSFVACSGVSTGSTFDSSFLDAGTGSLLNGADTEPSQLDALSSTGTKYVTLTMGGNDLGFPKILQDCMDITTKLGPIFKTVSSPFSSPTQCSSDLTEAETLLSTSSGTSQLESALAYIYGEILTNVPNARVLVLNYPQIFTTTPPTGFCPVRLGTPVPYYPYPTLYLSLSQQHVLQFDNLESQLNAAIATEAQFLQGFGSKIELVDINTGTRSQAIPCNTKTNGLSDINTVRLAAGATVASLYHCVTGPCTFDPVATDSFHPKSSAHRYMASQVEAAINAGSLGILTTSLPEGTVGQTYDSTVSASGGTTPYQWSISSGSLPSGLSLNTSTGEITGSPSSAGTTSFVAKVTDPSNNQATRTFTLQVLPGSGSLSISNTVLPNFSMSEPYATQFIASGGVGTDTWSISGGALPSGLSLSTSGAISGTPTSSDPATFIAQVTDSANEVASAQFTIVNQPVANPVIQSFTTSVTGQTVTFNLHVTDANSVGLWSGAINFACYDPLTGAETGGAGFIWFANPAAGAASGSDTSSLVSGTLNDGEYNPSINLTPLYPNGLYGSCQIDVVDVSDQDGGSVIYGNPGEPTFPFSANFSIPPPS